MSQSPLFTRSTGTGSVSLRATLRPVVLGVSAAMLVACSQEVPRSFAAPDEERERLVDAVDANCQQERTDYWFCTAEDGFFHLFVERKGPGGAMVRTVMLDRNSGTGLQEELVALYGFSPEQLQTVLSGSRDEVVEGGFVLRLDPTWQEPIIQVHVDSIRQAGK